MIHDVIIHSKESHVAILLSEVPPNPEQPGNLRAIFCHEHNSDQQQHPERHLVEFDLSLSFQ